ncbi:hypothetical protein [Fodinicola feengrottensis]|uniref:DUF4440 domain-containing protein n=1 Tax=Fodinicola feengrottensis TaxID=435914 RepID=A0ABN2GZ52_9ACTN|nr:hypothetical protein [Fodinicola feengrottensis]
MESLDLVEKELTARTAEFFRAVSFETAGKPRYDQIYDLFIEGGLLIKNSESKPEIMTVAEFIAPRQALVDVGRLTSFEETEIEHRIDTFGQVAHHLCTYAKTGVLDGVATQGRGVISTQFVRTPDGWKMSSMAWDDERDGQSIPAL